ncbi:MAG: FAD-dependent oxidoreductase [Pseudoxanthomonas mexicana]|nr:FAD-dependent oxidoreductase [Pseudoxanthomonas mexicana]
MRIAIVGAGIAGLGAAYLLGRRHEVVVYEAEQRLGGHTHTHSIELAGERQQVDTGFIVFNPDHYPLLTRLFGELGVESQPTIMSFAVKNEITGLEYNATNVERLFCQRRNLLLPAFWRMVREILRFYREAPALLADPGPGPTIGEYLYRGGYGALFIEDHLLPMASALWSSPTETVMDFPAKYLVQFMANHQMLDAGTRKPWRVVRGGSSRYLDKLVPAIRAEFRRGAPVRSVHRDADGVTLRVDGDSSRFDQVVLACHADQALAMLADPSASEAGVLGAMRFQRNDTVLHTDTSLLPRNPRAWAAWNALRLKPDPRHPAAHACTVSYSMNLLQGLASTQQFIVTLNATQRIDPAKILARMDYAHPLYSHASVAAQGRWAEVSGARRTWYAGAYWGWGFHEDGLRSGVRVAQALGCDW